MRSISPVSSLSLFLFLAPSFLSLRITGSPVDLMPAASLSASERPSSSSVATSSSSPSKNTSDSSSTANDLIWCHRSFGQHLTAQLPDCLQVLQVLEFHDDKDIGREAIFSWDPHTATRSPGDVYLLPKTIKRGNCQARVELNGVKSVRALWGVDVWDSFGQVMAGCLVKQGLGGYTFAQRTGTGLRVTLKGLDGGGEGGGGGGGDGGAMGVGFQASAGNVSTW